MTTEEEFCLDRIDRIIQKARAEAEPYVKRLCEIAARKPMPVILVKERTQILGRVEG